MKKYFITGTDTDCGKTYITNQLNRLVNDSAAIKPIASGCDEIDGELFNSDALLHQKHSDLPMDLINPWRFKSPVSPHLAAQEACSTLDIQAIASYCLNFSDPTINTLFIEGAGGLMVPLNETSTWLDFLKLTEFPVILVVGMKLGCLNHALLTQAVMELNHVECIGWVANCIDPEMLMLDENIDTLKHKLNFPLLGVAPYNQGIREFIWPPHKTP
ncbi:dethiobiotin synthase [Legionella waltersii]|uniref:ATP-dependent dethiobiotin synthetase BioD n=1 Tax=Legionella waltersii TaxID=66969 RepID=A0A0W1A1W1_9GAMM|nr:dethiobiotin synthase [Legionella waltersii]KTD75120.1 dethiobiotin synthetase [Legionella waltersii]SNV04976.1 dethiobiotin synthetase [Legionella waltersii]